MSVHRRPEPVTFPASYRPGHPPQRQVCYLGNSCRVNNSVWLSLSSWRMASSCRSTESKRLCVTKPQQIVVDDLRQCRSPAFLFKGTFLP
jgi:hypothetical protein